MDTTEQFEEQQPDKGLNIRRLEVTIETDHGLETVVLTEARAGDLARWLGHPDGNELEEPSGLGDSYRKIRDMFDEAKTWDWLDMPKGATDIDVLHRLTKMAASLRVANRSSKRRGEERDEWRRLAGIETELSEQRLEAARHHMGELNAAVLEKQAAEAQRDAARAEVDRLEAREVPEPDDATKNARRHAESLKVMGRESKGRKYLLAMCDEVDAFASDAAQLPEPTLPEGARAAIEHATQVLRHGGHVLRQTAGPRPEKALQLEHAGDRLAAVLSKAGSPPSPDELDCGKPVIMGHGNDYQCERPQGHEGRCGELWEGQELGELATAALVAKAREVQPWDTEPPRREAVVARSCPGMKTACRIHGCQDNWDWCKSAGCQLAGLESTPAPEPGVLHCDDHGEAGCTLCTGFDSAWHRRPIAKRGTPGSTEPARDLVEQIERLRRNAGSPGMRHGISPTQVLAALRSEASEVGEEEPGTPDAVREAAGCVAVALHLIIAHGGQPDVELAEEAARLRKRLDHVEAGGTWAEAKAREGGTEP